MNLQDAVALYIKMRDKKAAIVAAHKESIAPLDENMAKLEAKLLQAFEASGVDSVKTPAGTAYTTTRTTASVADKEVFMAHVKENGDWDLLEVRASKGAVEAYQAEKTELPPGINIRVERVVNVRRSS